MSTQVDFNLSTPVRGDHVIIRDLELPDLAARLTSAPDSRSRIAA
jgi:hypothetical protein